MKFKFALRELTHWKRLWCWEGLGAVGEGDDRGWDGWMASQIRWTWVWVNSRRWCWTGRPGMLRFMGSQRVGDDWATELNWTGLNWKRVKVFPGGSEGKASACNAGDQGSVSESGRSPGEGNGYPLQYYVFAWIPWTEEPGRLQSIGSQRVRHDWVTSLTHPKKYLYTDCVIFLNNITMWNTAKTKPKQCSVHFSRSVFSNSLRPHELQHTRPPCPSPSPGVPQTHVHWVGDAIQPSHPL